MQSVYCVRSIQGDAVTVDWVLKRIVKEAFYFHCNAEMRARILKREKQGFCSL